MRRLLVAPLWCVSARLAVIAMRLSGHLQEPRDAWVGWARHFGDNRNHWEPVCYRPSEGLAWVSLGHYQDQYPETSSVVLPNGIPPEDAPTTQAHDH